MKGVVPPSAARVNVVVLDDEVEAAQKYAELIYQAVQIEVSFTNEPDEAIALVKSQDILVAVLDQDLSFSNSAFRKGTDVYEEMRRFAPGLKVIMFSSRSDRIDGHMATKLRFDATFDKSQVEAIAEAVESQLALARLDRLEVLPAVATPVGRGRRWWRRHKVGHSFIGAEVVDGEVAGPEGWRQLGTVAPGHHLELQETTVVRHRIEIEESTRAMLKSGFNVDLVGGRFKSALDSHLESFVASREVEEVSRTSVRTMRYELAEGATVDGESVRLRIIEQAPLYSRVRSKLKVDCFECGIAHVSAFTVLVDTGRVGDRYIDVLESGRKVVVSAPAIS